MLIQKMWNDDKGFVVSIELVLIATIAVIGLITGLTAVRDGVVSELSDVAGAVQDINQSYTINGVVGHSAATAGMDFLDDNDHCDDNDQLTDGSSDNCITFDGPALQEDTDISDVFN